MDVRSIREISLERLLASIAVLIACSMDGIKSVVKVSVPWCFLALMVALSTPSGVNSLARSYGGTGSKICLRRQKQAYASRLIILLG